MSDQTPEPDPRDGTDHPTGDAPASGEQPTRDTTAPTGAVDDGSRGGNAVKRVLDEHPSWAAQVPDLGQGRRGDPATTKTSRADALRPNG